MSSASSSPLHTLNLRILPPPSRHGQGQPCPPSHHPPHLSPITPIACESTGALRHTTTTTTASFLNPEKQRGRRREEEVVGEPDAGTYQLPLLLTVLTNQHRILAIHHLCAPRTTSYPHRFAYPPTYYLGNLPCQNWRPSHYSRRQCTSVREAVSMHARDTCLPLLLLLLLLLLALERGGTERTASSRS
ncbi:uncharacterized protein BKA78DRAFT_162715 [Phyllosticta capitalensis]|uniref:uncharacterized protein n=1 Tax=Phyllosticta capitalensis TaxID=121624 RepID=UPI00312D8CEB